MCLSLSFIVDMICTQKVKVSLMLINYGHITKSSLKSIAQEYWNGKKRNMKEYK